MPVYATAAEAEAEVRVDFEMDVVLTNKGWKWTEPLSSLTLPDDEA